MNWNMKNVEIVDKSRLEGEVANAKPRGQGLPELLWQESGVKWQVV